MPRTFTDGFTASLVKDAFETHSTLELSIPSDITDSIIYYLATAPVTVAGVLHSAQLRNTSALKQSLTRAADRVTLEIQNVDTLFGLELASVADALYGARVRVGRYWRNLRSGLITHKYMLTGVVVAAKTDQNVVQIQAVSDAYAAVSVGAREPVVRNCRWEAIGGFRGPQCGYSGDELVCNFLLDHADGCEGRHGTPLKMAKYGGYATIKSQSSVAGAAGTGLPAVNQLVKIAGVALEQRTSINFLAGAIAVDNAGADRTDVTITANGLGVVNYIINVKDAPYSAVGDGSNDDTAEIQAALNAAAADSKKPPVYFPPGTYKITSALTVASGVSLFGHGASSIITGSFAGRLIEIASSAANINIRALKTAGAHQTAIYLGTGANKITIRDCIFTGCTAHTGGVTTTTVLLNGQNSDVWIERNIFEGNGSLHAADDGADIMANASATPFHNRIHINHNQISGGDSRFSIACFDTFDSELIGNSIDQNNKLAASTPANISGYGIVVYATVNTGVIKRNRVNGNQIKNCAGSGIYLVNCLHSSVIGNTLEDTCKQQVDGTLPVAAISLNGGDHGAVVGNTIVKTTTGNGIALAANYGSAELATTVNNSVTTFVFDDVSVWGRSGDRVTFTIDSETVTGLIDAGAPTTTISSCTRGIYGTTAAGHTAGATATIAGPSGMVCAGNAIRNIGGNAGINFRNRVDGVVVDGNEIVECGIGVFNSGIPVIDARITNNSIDRTSSQGINLDNATGVLIAGNRLKQPAAQGVLLQDGAYNTIVDNLVSDAGSGAFDMRCDDSIIAQNEALRSVVGFDDSGARNVYTDNKAPNCSTTVTLDSGMTSQRIKITSGATPDLSGGDFFILEYASPTTITNFTGMSALDKPKVLLAMNGNVTIQGGGAISLRGNVNYAMAQYDALVIGYHAGIYELSRKTAVNPVYGSRFISGVDTYGQPLELIGNAGSWLAITKNSSTTGYGGFRAYNSANSVGLELTGTSYGTAFVTNGPSSGPAAYLYTGAAYPLVLATNNVARLQLDANGLTIFEQSAPGTPAANSLVIYAKDKSGVSTLYYKKDDGTEVEVSTGGGSGTINTGADKKLAYYSGAGTTLDDATAIEYNGGASPNVLITSQNAAHVNLRLAMAATQTAAPLEIKDSSSNLIFEVKSTGGWNAAGDSFFSLTGSSTSFPRKLQLSNGGSGTAFRFETESEGTGLQVREVGKLQLFARYGIKLVGTRNSTSAPAFETGATTDPALHVENGVTTAIPLRVNAISSTSTNLVEYQSNGSNVAEISTAGRLTNRQLAGNGAAPSTSTGTGAGTGPSLVIDGTDTAGALLLTTGTGPAANAKILDVTLSANFTNYPVVMLTPGNAAAAALSGGSAVFVSDADMLAGKWTLKSGSAALAATTDYVWYYHVIGF